MNIEAMLLNQFDKRFPTEESCIDYFLCVVKSSRSLHHTE